MHSPASLSPAITAPDLTQVFAIAAQHADAVDREGRIPTEALQALREEKLLGLLVPRRFGGPELPMRAVANLCRRLSESCASTGLIFAMHHSQAAVAIRQTAESAWHHALMEDLVRKQHLVASATTEGGVGGSIRTSSCFLDRRTDGLYLDKGGAVISYSAAADVFLVSARRAEDAAASDQQLVSVMRDQLTLTPRGRWNPIGMRGACTDRFDLAAHCSNDQIFEGTFAKAMSEAMLPTSHILLGSVWLGVAVSALSRARGFLRMRNRKGMPLNPIANLRLAEGEALVQQMRGMLAANVALYEDGVSQASGLDRMVSYNALKVGASELVVRITDIALRICGIQGYMEEGEFYLSRHIRDAHSAAVMVNDDRILGNMSSVVLGAPLERDI
ncbi:acyl-CoA dehydrogenase family protein [Paracidovorax wautersii]|uniref:acyl-CoA dehydrogenase family protein n=1 Tax=Paracidovorax wautersii TaxID=1177982 RepID=UPI0031D7CAC0